MKIIKRIAVGVGCIMLIIVAFGYNALFSPFVRPPPIGRDLPSNFRAADEEFQSRVSEQLLGKDIAEIRSQLTEQGFEITDNVEGRTFARFEKSSFPCTLVWNIHWEEQNGSVVDLKSLYGGICL